MNITKKPLVKEMAKFTKVPVEQASFIYDVMMSIMIKEIKAGNDIVLPNIGTLRLVKGRELRSNITGENVPPHLRLKFKVNISLARYIRVSTREFPIR